MQGTQLQQQPRFFHMPKFQAPNYQKPTHLFSAHRQHAQQVQAIEFDGKRLRKAVTRKTVDYNSSIIKYLETRVWQRDYRDRRVMQPDVGYYTEMTPPISMPDNPINAVTTKFVRTSTNKMRCPIFCVAWTPEGRRLVTGASSGEFTLWNGLTFNFETILQAHDSPVRCMVWSHNDVWMVTGDHAGYVKYWQSNMNNVKMFQAHKEPLRGISFCPTDTKFTTCSDDGTVRIWDFFKCFEERILRGHGADVKCVDWHPQKSLIVSGSKDSQQPIKLWDPKTGQSLATIHAHKNTVMEAKWNKNGNWLLTASRDHLLKLFDIRNMSQEVQTFRGHKKEATSLAWHPVHEGLFTSGGSDGSVMFWVVGADKEVGSMEQAHDSCVWSLAWHPLGHILCSGSNDHTSKFWTRNRPGDRMRDKYNLNTAPKGQEEASEYDDAGTISSIPGMGLEYGLLEHLKPQEQEYEEEIIIPGLDFSSEELLNGEKNQIQKKIPFSKPIPKQFQQQWMESKQPLLLAPPTEDRNDSESQISHATDAQVPPGPPPPLTSQDQHNQYSFQGKGRGNARMNQQATSYSTHGQEGNRSAPRTVLLGERPLESNLISSAQSSQEHSEITASNHEEFTYLDQDDRHPDFAHERIQNREEEMQHVKWRTYSDQQGRIERPLSEKDSVSRNSLPAQNMKHLHYDTEQNANVSNSSGGEFYKNNAFSESEKYTTSDDISANHPDSVAQFNSEKMLLPVEKDMRYSESDLRLHLSAKDHHMMASAEDIGYGAPHKRLWHEGPGSENYYPSEQSMHEYGYIQDYGSRLPMRPGGSHMVYHGGRGYRGQYRGRSPYRIVNQRGRGVRSGFLD